MTNTFSTQTEPAEETKQERKEETPQTTEESEHKPAEDVKAEHPDTPEELPEETEQATSAEDEHKEEVFKLHKPEFVSKINVIGQIDLAALNQSTRPKKKSKEEKRKEREEKEKLRQDQKKLLKEAIIKEIRRDDNKKNGNEEANNKKKRIRINKEKVDINNASNFQRPALGGSREACNSRRNVASLISDVGLRGP